MALFNTDDVSTRTVVANFSSLWGGSAGGIPAPAPARCQVRDLWQRHELGAATGRVAVTLPPHASALVALHSCE